MVVLFASLLTPDTQTERLIQLILSSFKNTWSAASLMTFFLLVHCYAVYTFKIDITCSISDLKSQNVLIPSHAPLAIYEPHGHLFLLLPAQLSD